MTGSMDGVDASWLASLPGVSALASDFLSHVNFVLASDVSWLASLPGGCELPSDRPSCEHSALASADGVDASWLASLPGGSVLPSELSSPRRSRSPLRDATSRSDSQIDEEWFAEVSAALLTERKSTSGVDSSELAMLTPWGLFIGGRAEADDISALREAGISALVNLAPGECRAADEHWGSCYPAESQLKKQRMMGSMPFWNYMPMSWKNSLKPDGGRVDPCLCIASLASTAVRHCVPHTS
mmetsp:Transcript_85839/g.223726  ORF Transcript_85839/g.223726 Transcript_85839/m.223726 type:complete len:242 (+) Transcript_85839:1-726(+)